MTPAVSVIIPAFNAAEFLEECLDSIKGQTFGDFEAVIVDDGSDDGTASIAERFAGKDSRFRLIRQPNTGVSGARNVGIENASGEFVTFVDADDFLHPDALRCWVETARKAGSDVCISELKRDGEEGSFSQPEFEEIDYASLMRLALYQKRLLNSPCGVLIKRSLLGDDKRFTEGIRYEDLDAFYRFYEGARKIVLVPRSYYFYRKNPASFMNLWSDSRLDVLDVTDKMTKFFEKHYPEISAAAHDRRFSAHYNMLLLMMRHKVKNPQAIARCMGVIKAGRKRALLDREVRVKNKLGALASYGGRPLLRLLSKL